MKTATMQAVLPASPWTPALKNARLSKTPYGTEALAVVSLVHWMEEIQISQIAMSQNVL